jgi:hypothetical protein
MTVCTHKKQHCPLAWRSPLPSGLYRQRPKHQQKHLTEKWQVTLVAAIEIKITTAFRNVSFFPLHHRADAPHAHNLSCLLDILDRLACLVFLQSSPPQPLPVVVFLPVLSPLPHLPIHKLEIVELTQGRRVNGRRDAVEVTRLGHDNAHVVEASGYLTLVTDLFANLCHCCPRPALSIQMLVALPPEVQ